VLSGCEFLKWCKENPESVSHEQWFPMCAITYTIDPSGDLTHAYSANWSRYDKDEVDRQLSYLSYEKSNVTCERVESVWGNCTSCTNYCKVAHPTDIKRESFFAGSTTGYRITNANGSKGKPDYEDLYRYFAHENLYISIDSTEELYIYTQGIWKSEPTSRVAAFALKHLDKSRRTERAEFLDFVLHQNLQPISFFEKAGSGLVNFKNGVLDLDTGVLHPHDPKYGFRWQLEFDYDKTATAPKYESMMRRVCGEDQEKLDLLQEIGGYIVSGTPPNKHQKFFMLLGEGANGKTTFFYAIAECIGENAHTAKKPSELAKEEGRAALVGKLLNFCDETPKELFSSEVIKQLATGSPISYRYLYSAAVTEELIAKHMFACNELPRNNDSTHGLMRKTIIVPFTVTIPVEEQLKLGIVRKIFRSEAAGIFNNFYEGYKRLEKNGGFTKCQASAAALEMFKAQSDSVREWANECVITDREGFVSVENVYHHYKEWCEDNGARPKAKSTLGRSLTRIFGESKLKKVQGRAIRGYENVKIIDSLTGEDVYGSNSPTF
jgi:P4 family phage/plasmid primase-like protien